MAKGIETQLEDLLEKFQENRKEALWLLELIRKRKEEFPEESDDRKYYESIIQSLKLSVPLWRGKSKI
jgi:hypothetical protein